MAKARMVWWAFIAQILSILFSFELRALEYLGPLADDARLSYYEEAKLAYVDAVAPEIKKTKITLTHDKRPTLKRGSIFIQGSLSLGYKLIGFSRMQHALKLNSNVGAAYFIKDRWAVGASIPASLNFLQGMKGDAGISLLSTYFFEIKKIFYPYVSGDITPRFSPSQRAFLLSAGVKGGILLGLNERVALDFCFGPELFFPLGDRQKWQIEVPASFAGIIVFF